MRLPGADISGQRFVWTESVIEPNDLNRKGDSRLICIASAKGSCERIGVVFRDVR